MQYRIDERSGNKLSILGFGCMRFHRNLGVIDQRRVDKLVLDAVESGVNYFDTAYLYGGSESALGAALNKQNLRNKVYIATKLPIANCNSKADFDTYFNKQLASLNTDYIDYYLMHNINSLSQWEELCSLGIEKWISTQKTAGKIKQIGFSYHGARDEFKKVLDAYDWEFCQIQYNYTNENYQAGIAGLKEAYARKLPVIIMEPLLGGKLATGLSLAAKAAFQKVNKDRSPAEWALLWLWNQPEVTVVLSGMNDQAQLDENIKIADNANSGQLSSAEIGAYEDVLEIFKTTDKIPCTSCSYCMPCPQGVNIPSCFASYNASYTHGRITSLAMYITSTAANRDDKSLASNCIGCGKCEQHCPQNIEIRNNLKNVSRRMEPFYFTLVMNIMRSHSKRSPKSQEQA